MMQKQFFTHILVLLLFFAAPVMLGNTVVNSPSISKDLNVAKQSAPRLRQPGAMTDRSSRQRKIKPTKKLAKKKKNSVRLRKKSDKKIKPVAKQGKTRTKRLKKLNKKSIVKKSGVATSIDVSKIKDTTIQQNVSVKDPKKRKVRIDESKLYELDSIEAVVFGDDNTRVITKSDVVRPGIDGSQRSRDDLVLEQLMYDDAKKYKIVPDADGIDKHLKTVQRENNLTQDQMQQIFQAAGYTFEEGKKQFGVMTAVNSLIDFKIGPRRLIVPETKIKEYYDAHPEYEQGAYELQRAFVPFKLGVPRDELKQNIERGIEQVTWSDPFWVEAENMAEDKLFIFDMVESAVSDPLETEDGFELFRLKTKREQRLLSFEERRMDIIGILRRPQFQQALGDYKKELLGNGAVLYFG